MVIMRLPPITWKPGVLKKKFRSRNVLKRVILSYFRFAFLLQKAVVVGRNDVPALVRPITLKNVQKGFHGA